MPRGVRPKPKLPVRYLKWQRRRTAPTQLVVERTRKAIKGLQAQLAKMEKVAHTRYSRKKYQNKHYSYALSKQEYIKYAAILEKIDQLKSEHDWALEKVRVKRARARIWARIWAMKKSR